MANKEKQPTEEYKTPILSVIYNLCGLLTTGAGLLMFIGGFAFGGVSMLEGMIAVFAGITLFGIAQVITFIAKIELNSRESAEHNRIASKNSIIIVSNTYKTLQAVLEANQTIAPKELPKTDLE